MRKTPAIIAWRPQSFLYGNKSVLVMPALGAGIHVFLPLV
jgi:hypothetical protein